MILKKNVKLLLIVCSALLFNIIPVYSDVSLENKLKNLKNNLKNSTAAKRKSLKEIMKNEKAKEFAVKKENEYSKRINEISLKINKLKHDINNLEIKINEINEKENLLSDNLKIEKDKLVKQQVVLGNRIRSVFKEKKKYSALSRFFYVLNSDGFMELNKRLKLISMLTDADRNFIDKVNLRIESIELKSQKLQNLKKEKYQYLQLRKDLLDKNKKDQENYKTLLENARNDKKQYEHIIKNMRRQMKILDESINQLKLSAVETKEQIRLSRMKFKKLKGNMPWPVKKSKYNKVLVKYISRDKEYHFDNISDGIEIKCHRDQKVVSVAKGVVVLNGWINSLGNTVIISHGGGYYTLYAHLNRFNCKKDDSVVPLQVIGYAGDSASLYGISLYFQVRENKKTIDPQLWLKK